MPIITKLLNFDISAGIIFSESIIGFMSKILSFMDIWMYS